MWQWIVANASALSVFTKLGTLVIWLLFAQLFWMGFRRQRQARIVIAQGWGEQLDSVCLVANMSHEPIFIQHIVLTLCLDDGEYPSDVTDFDEVQPYDSANRPEEVTRQGPLLSGRQMKLDTFRELIRHSAEHSGLATSAEQPMTTLRLHGFRITVIAHYGPSGEVIGARRTFSVSGDDNQLMRPDSLSTERLQNRAARKRMRTWLENQISE